MKLDETYKKLNSKLCECIFNTIYNMEKEVDGHYNLAKLSCELYTKITKIIDEIIK